MSLVRIQSPRPSLIWGLRPQTPTRSLTRFASSDKHLGKHLGKSRYVREASRLTGARFLIWPELVEVQIAIASVTTMMSPAMVLLDQLRAIANPLVPTVSGASPLMRIAASQNPHRRGRLFDSRLAT